MTLLSTAAHGSEACRAVFNEMECFYWEAVEGDFVTTDPLAVMALKDRTHELCESFGIEAEAFYDFVASTMPNFLPYTVG